MKNDQLTINGTSIDLKINRILPDIIDTLEIDMITDINILYQSLINNITKLEAKFIDLFDKGDISIPNEKKIENQAKFHEVKDIIDTDIKKLEEDTNKEFLKVRQLIAGKNKSLLLVLSAMLKRIDEIINARSKDMDKNVYDKLCSLRKDFEVYENEISRNKALNIFEKIRRFMLTIF